MHMGVVNLKISGSVLVVAPQTPPPSKVYKSPTVTVGLSYPSEGGGPPPSESVQKSTLLKLLKLCRTTVL